MPTRTRIVLLVLVLIASGLAAAFMVLLGMRADFLMTPEQSARVRTASDVVCDLFWAMQIPIVWVVWRGSWAYRGLLQVPLSLFWSVVCSIGGGFLWLTLSDKVWIRVIYHLSLR
ncbi:hypothetical protein [Acidobacterium sp. S8]|uniref:hypothetical protein n=1 Tax=Acidobacterium sp. S8 TaxID=1641854 RepID=UPI00131A8B2A|nr:hypothetical protein [Acidobacterium sp. S8]